MTSSRRWFALLFLFFSVTFLSSCSDTTLQGTARDAKGGAVVVLESGEVVYVAGLFEWPPDVFGKRVKVTGRLRQKKMIPDPQVDPVTGAVSAGAVGEQDVLENPQWEILK